MNSVTKEIIEGYYNLLEEALHKYDLSKETCTADHDAFGPLPPNVVAKRGQRKICYCVASKKEQITGEVQGAYYGI